MFSFERLSVYEKALKANQKVYRFIKRQDTMPVYIKNQFGRAGLSVLLNIAEGSAKFSIKDQRNFYSIARGSVCECVALVEFIATEGEMDQATQREFYKDYEEISKMLFAMIKASQ